MATKGIHAKVVHFFAPLLCFALSLSLSRCLVVSLACYFRVVVLCFAIVANEYLGQLSLNCCVEVGEGGQAGRGNCQIVAKLVCKCSGRPKLRGRLCCLRLPCVAYTQYFANNIPATLLNSRLIAVVVVATAHLGILGPAPADLYLLQNSI